MHQVTEYAGISIKDVEAVAVSCGPGSFTGLRIGMAAAQGFAFAGNIPLLAIPTFDAMAYRISCRMMLPDDTHLLIAFDARRQDVYAALYQLRSSGPLCILPAFAASLDEIGQKVNDTVWLAGNGASKLIAAYPKKFHIIPEQEAVHHAESVALLGEIYLSEGKIADTASCEPLYIRDFQTTQPKHP